MSGRPRRLWGDRHPQGFNIDCPPAGLPIDWPYRRQGEVELQGPDLFLAASPLIQLHAVLAAGAIILGAIQFALPKGTGTHRVLGRIWVALMAVVALSSFFIHELRIFGPFSAIHLLSILVLISLWQAIRLARQGDIARHKKTMIRLYVLALLITGAFTFLPGRLMHRVFFGG